MIQHVLAISGMHCASCGILIDDALEDLPGVLSARTDVRSETTTVELEGSQTSLDEVFAAVASEGYGVTLIS
jgi:copper chaperone